MAKKFERKTEQKHPTNLIDHVNQETDKSDLDKKERLKTTK